jgi:hypothetical protein
VGECRSCSKCELKRLLEEKTTKDHEMMTIAVLRLHDSGSLEACGIHEVEIIWLS